MLTQPNPSSSSLSYTNNARQKDRQADKKEARALVGAGMFKKLAINLVRDNQSVGIPRHEFNVENPEKWLTEIEVARRTQKESMFTIQKEIKEIAREIVKIRCSYCGMLVEQNLARCPNCNGLLR
jgi:rubrerythrin